MIKNLLDADEPGGYEAATPASKPARKEVLGLFDDADPFTGTTEPEPFILSNVEPEPFGETARKSGIAWSMGIAFFSSVVFMLLLGWGADLLIGSSPWGVVAGIVIGSLIGFVQLFRLSSQIFRK